MFSPSSRNPVSGDFVFTLMKILVGVGIIIVTIGLILFLNLSLSNAAVSVYVQLAVDGAVMVVMSCLSIRIFRGLEYV